MGQPRSTPPEIKSIYVIPPYKARCKVRPRRLRSLRPLTSPSRVSRSPDTKSACPYSNGDEIRGQFKDKMTAVAFLVGIR